MNTLRRAAVAGTFYAADPHVLATHIETLLEAAASINLTDSANTAQVPKALIVPHAGYMYSGPIAATAYAQLKSVQSTIRRVVLLGPSHRVHVDGLALAGAEAFSTPLGQISVDEEALAVLRSMPSIQEFPAAHQWEHSLEVQLPFLQTLFDHFTLVPLVVGNATPKQVAEVLESVWGGPETLIIISSDLSHYLPYKAARETDQITADAILNLQRFVTLHEACGGVPVNGLMHVAKQYGLQPRLLDLRNSGDTAGDKSRVVGYGSFGFYAAH